MTTNESIGRFPTPDEMVKAELFPSPPYTKAQLQAMIDAEQPENGLTQHYRAKLEELDAINQFREAVRESWVTVEKPRVLIQSSHSRVVISQDDESPEDPYAFTLRAEVVTVDAMGEQAWVEAGHPRDVLYTALSELVKSLRKEYA
jgi:hypothetical protein